MLGHLGVEVVHEHAHGGFGLPGGAGADVAARGANRSSAGKGGDGGRGGSRRGGGGHIKGYRRIGANALENRGEPSTSGEVAKRRAQRAI